MLRKLKKHLVQSQKKIFVPIIFLFIVIVSIAEITAYLSDADTAINKLTIGGNTIDIIEEFDPPEEIQPGISFTKDVKVKNTGSSDCYVRIKAIFSNSHMEQYTEINWNNTIWIYNAEDGYWYYSEKLISGAETPSLFTTVKIKEDAPESAIIDFDIIIYAESVECQQGTGFDNYTDAWTHYQKNKS